MILETLPTVLRFTTEQKIRLCWELADDVAQNAVVSPELMHLLDQRLDAYETDPNAVKTTAQVSEGIMALKQRLATA